jgi:pyrophosphatase PpaX
MSSVPTDDTPAYLYAFGEKVLQTANEPHTELHGLGSLRFTAKIAETQDQVCWTKRVETPMRERYSTILFDFDGTLTPSLQLWVEAFQYAFEHYRVAVSTSEIVEQCFYRSWDEIALQYKIPPGADFRRQIEEGLELAFEKAELFEGVSDVLQECQRHGIAMAIVTSSSRRIVERVVERTEIGLYFSALITSDDIKNFKPHPEPVHAALERLGRAAHETLLIGDSISDMLAAKAAGVDHALFYHDDQRHFVNYEQLLATEPKFVFGNFSDIATHLAPATIKRS